MEKQGGPLNASTSLRGLPLFAATTVPDETVPENDEVSHLRKALGDINPDTMTPKQALEALYLLKALVPACADGAT
jgi:DNA mismatch repair protein MutS